MSTVTDLRRMARIHNETTKGTKLKGYSTANKDKLREMLTAAGVALPEDTKSKKGPASAPAAPIASAAAAASNDASALKEALAELAALKAKMAIATSKKPALRYVKLADLSVDAGELVVMGAEYMDEAKYDDLQEMEKGMKAASLGTGGDGTFAVYAVYEEGQQDNLPLEYRIGISEDRYGDKVVSDEENERLLEKDYRKNGAGAKTTPVGTKYALRAETEVDVDRWLFLVKGKVNNVVTASSTLKIAEDKELPIPDADVTFYSTLSLDELRESMRQVEDAHVMMETVNTAEAYTGERYYDE